MDAVVRPTPGTFRRCATLALVVATALGGCAAVGPNFRPDPPAAPDAWAAAPDAGSPTGKADDLASRPVARPFDGRRWWSVFGDPLLDTLVDEAVRQNLDLASATARIAEARARRELAAGSELPSIAATGIAGRQRASENGIFSALGGSSASASSTPPGSGTAPADAGSSASMTNLFQAGFDATWELDLWGKTRRSVEAAAASVVAAEQSRGDAQVSLTAEVARNYLELRGAQRQRAILEADLATQDRLLALAGSQAASGLAPRTDPLRRSAELLQSRSQLPQVAQTIAQTEDRLALLLALPPGALAARLETGVGPIAPLPPEVPIGLPGELLRRRPDIARSEAELHAATARVGVAEAQLFPSIELGATAGLQSVGFGSLADWGSRFFIAGAQVSMPVFQGGRLKAQVRVADAQLQEALLDYRRTVLAAFHDADDALIAYAEAQRRTRALVGRTADLDRGRTLVVERWRAGLAAFSEVLTSERELRQAELVALESNVTASTRLVALYKALGGDWGASPAPDSGR